MNASLRWPFLIGSKFTEIFPETIHCVGHNLNQTRKSSATAARARLFSSARRYGKDGIAAAGWRLCEYIIQLRSDDLQITGVHES